MGHGFHVKYPDGEFMIKAHPKHPPRNHGLVGDNDQHQETWYYCYVYSLFLMDGRMDGTGRDGTGRDRLDR